MSVSYSEKEEKKTINNKHPSLHGTPAKNS